MASDETAPRQPGSTDTWRVPRFSFSTDMLPEPERASFFKEELTPLLHLDVELLDTIRPRHAMSFVKAGPAALSSIDVSPTAFHRTRRHDDGNGDFFFNPMTEGWQYYTTGDQTLRLDAGQGCLLAVDSAGTCHFPNGGRALGIRIDGAALRARVKRPEEMTFRPVGLDHPGVALLMGYLRSFSEVRDTLTPALLHSFGLHVVDLVAAILGATRDGAAIAADGGVKAARLRQVFVRIAERGCEPGFTVETMAAELAVSSRTIQLILEETGSTFSEHVVEHRLRHAWRLLSDPQSALSIAEVALDSGFNDLSHFYRAFRRRFGETPASARSSARQLH